MSLPDDGAAAEAGTTAAGPVPARPALARQRGLVALTVLHTRYRFLETVRIPVAVIGNLLFPALALLFFVVPQRSVADDPVAATAAIGQLATFALMSACLFTLGLGVSEDRALPFNPFLRTLPAGPFPQLGGHVVNGLVFALFGLTPLALIGWLLTAASVTWSQLGAGAALLGVVAIPFLLLAVGIGYSLPPKAAIAVVQAVLFPLAFAGGLFLPPQAFPAWLETFSRFLPSRAARDLVVQGLTGEPAYAGALLVLLAWTGALAAFAWWAYRRDEGQRFG